MNAFIILLVVCSSCISYARGLAPHNANPVDTTQLISPHPTLSVKIAPPNCSSKNPNDSVLKNFRGLVMQQISSTSVYAFMHSIFFDSSSAAIPCRYQLFTTATETKSFSDEQIRGGTFEKYYHILNIIGYRLQKNPKSTLRIRGYYNPIHFIYQEHEDTSLAQHRAQTVYSYLHDIWQIAKHRLKVEYHVFPDPFHTPNRLDSLCLDEYRRVEILCNDWEIMKPIIEKNTVIFPVPDEVTFVMNNGIDNSLIAERKIIISYNSREWNTLTEIGTTDSIALWDWQDTQGNFPDLSSQTNRLTNKTTDLGFYEARLEVITTTGKKYISNLVTIPVLYRKSDFGPYNFSCEKGESYSLLLFSDYNHHLSPYHKRILKEYIYPRCFPSSEVDVIGHTDILGMYEYNKLFSNSCAGSIEKSIRRHRKDIVTLHSKGVGEDEPLYNNALPEGRCFNRIVQVNIRTPLKDAKLNEGLLDLPHKSQP